MLLSHFHVGASTAPVNIDFRLGGEARLLFAQLLIFAQYSSPIGLGKKLYDWILVRLLGWQSKYSIGKVSKLTIGSIIMEF